MLKNDRWIKQMAFAEGMIEPFEAEQIREIKKDSGAKKVISYGLSSYGYDFRLADEFRVLPEQGPALDPKGVDPQAFTSLKSEGPFLLAPRSYVLGRSLEYFRIPRKIMTICMGKSTYARVGVVINVTPFEPEWEGFATMAICNTGTHPVKIYPHEGIGQLLFFESNEVCETSYRDKRGKYQAQLGITLPSV